MKWRAPTKIEVFDSEETTAELLRHSLPQKRRPLYPPEGVLCWR